MPTTTSRNFFTGFYGGHCGANILIQWYARCFFLILRVLSQQYCCWHGVRVIVARPANLKIAPLKKAIFSWHQLLYRSGYVGRTYILCGCMCVCGIPDCVHTYLTLTCILVYIGMGELDADWNGCWNGHWYALEWLLVRLLVRTGMAVGVHCSGRWCTLEWPLVCTQCAYSGVFLHIPVSVECCC